MAMQPCLAWKWDTHSQIVDKIYTSLPYTIKKNLNLAAMRDGSNDPDEKFHDTRAHSFPSSYTRANIWLDKGAASYKNKNYRDASYCFGVASHYISDSYSAPHCVSGESSYQHSKYEDQASYLTPTVTYSTNSLYNSMSTGKTQGSMSWNSWIVTKNKNLVQTDLNRGASASYSAIRKKMN
jgi:hypothetical protein